MQRLRRGALAAVGPLVAGLCWAASLPPWGWWPLGIVGVAVFDRSLAGRPVASRARRGWLAGAALLVPTWAWMWWMSPPGWLVAAAFFAGFVAAAAAAVPPDQGRRLALPAALVLAEWARGHWPFEGVPLSVLALGQAGGPLAGGARLGGALAVTGLVAVAGVGVSAALDRSWRPAALAGCVVAVLLVVAAVAPTPRDTGVLRVALVQGGGEQGTRAVTSDPRVVFARHLQASENIPGPVDLVVWPENVVSVDGSLAGRPEAEQLAQLARRLDATVLVGVVESDDDAGRFFNQAVAIAPDGTTVDRYDKVLRVPFGEYVPFRSLLTSVADLSLVPNDAVAGTGPAVLDTPAGPLAVAVSWEVFFSRRAADGVGAGGEVLVNPTNGSSYRGILVQSQQVAASRLRALETGRWVLQAAPTGFSAVIAPDATVLARTGIGEQAVLTAEITRREGLTLYGRTGDVLVLAAAALALAGAWYQARVRSPAAPSPARR